jgi:hypothetical protein
MKTLIVNRQQSILLIYLEQYRKLIKEISDCIENYQAGCGIRRLVEQHEWDWLIDSFYPKLENDLYDYISDAQVRKIKNSIEQTAIILSNLNRKDAYKKYADETVVSQDITTLMDAFSSTDIILMAMMPARREEMVKTY